MLPWKPCSFEGFTYKPLYEALVNLAKKYFENLSLEPLQATQLGIQFFMSAQFMSFQLSLLLKAWIQKLPKISKNSSVQAAGNT